MLRLSLQISIGLYAIKIEANSLLRSDANPSESGLYLLILFILLVAMDLFMGFEFVLIARTTKMTVPIVVFYVRRKSGPKLQAIRMKGPMSVFHLGNCSRIHCRSCDEPEPDPTLTCNHVPDFGCGTRLERKVGPNVYFSAYTECIHGDDEPPAVPFDD